MKNQELLRAFGIPRQAVRSWYAVPLVAPGLPDFFTAEGERLVQSAASALSCLQLEGTGNYMLIRDECVFSQSFSLLYGLLENPKDPIVVGGVHPQHSRLHPEALEDQKSENLAPVSVCTVVKALDRRSDCFLIEMVPRRHNASAMDELQAMGRLVESCIEGNHVIPPLALATDNHKSFAMITRALLGVLPPSQLAEATFWKTDRFKHFYIIVFCGVWFVDGGPFCAFLDWAYRHFDTFCILYYTLEPSNLTRDCEPQGKTSIPLFPFQASWLILKIYIYIIIYIYLFGGRVPCFWA